MSTQVLVEAERNLAAKLPAALPVFQTLAQRCLHVVPDPVVDALTRHAGAADPKDLPLLVAAHRERCRYLVTYNVRHYQPGLPGVQVLRPGELVSPGAGVVGVPGGLRVPWKASVRALVEPLWL